MKASTRPEEGSHISVRWSDCYTEDSWTPIKVLRSREPYYIQTTGWFVGVTKKGKLWIVSSGVSADGESAAATWFIPQAMIEEWSLV